jgi:hypothetical protein
MTDSKKFKMLLYGTVALVVLVLSFNLFQEQVLHDVEAYVQRRLHFERVISKKGLSLHRGMYWKGSKTEHDH